MGGYETSSGKSSKLIIEEIGKALDLRNTWLSLEESKHDISTYQHVVLNASFPNPVHSLIPLSMSFF